MSTSINQATVEEAVAASDTLMRASLGTVPGSYRPKGLILTKDQIVDLHRYEKKALNLPTEISKVIAYLGYSGSQDIGKGLRPEDFRECFTTVRNHALRWNPIKQRVKDVSGELKVFAHSMITYGGSIEAILGDIKGSQTLRAHGINTLEDLKRVKVELGDKFPDIGFDEDDTEAAKDFSEIIDRIIAKVAQHQQRTEELKIDLESYGNDLSYIVRPAIALQLTAIEGTTANYEIEKLQKEIDSLNKQIDEQNEAYKKTVKSSLESVGGLNIVGLGMAIYFGVEAEKIRKERNALKVKRDQKNNAMYELNRIRGRLAFIEADLQDLQALTVEADCATKNLITVWNKLHTYVLQSKEESMAITDAMRASTFAFHFKQVIAPWELVAQEADQLLGVFGEADDIIRLDTINSY